MNKEIKINISKIKNFRKVYESEKTGTMYSVSCPITSLYEKREELDKILEGNVRNAKKTAKPSKAMLETLKDKQEMFIFRNLGITLVATDVSWDNKTENLELTFDLTGENGLVNGGHTYQVIKSFISEIDQTEKNEIDAEVRLDIITGDNLKDEISDIIEARNTSTQVKDDTIKNSRGYFDIIKNSIKENNYSSDIAYYENQYVKENNPDSGYRQIKVSTILSYLMCFDSETFNENNHPTIAYSSKKKVHDWYVKKWEENKKDLEKLSRLLPEILDLKDYIESSIPSVWNDLSGRYANQEGVRKLISNKKLDYSNYEVGYDVPSGHIYPILGAFRSIVKKNEGEYVFLVDPKKLFDQMNKNKKSLVYKLINVENKDPQKIGKNQDLYDSCYATLKSYYYETK